VQHHCDMNM